MIYSAATEVLVTEMSKISDQIVTYCIIAAIVLVVLGLIIGSIKRTIRRIFK